MPVFHFKLISPESEDFSMEIEVKENQTFEDFYTSICSCMELKSKVFASFDVCDDKWNKKGTTIWLNKSSAKTTKKKLLIMKSVKMRDFVDKDVKIIFESDFLPATSLHIQVIDIYPAKQKVEYPHCVNKDGNLILNDFKNEIILDEKGADELKSSLLKDFENLLEDDFDDLGDF
jgi:hypothetical protein